MNVLAARLARARISASATSAQRTRELRAAGHDIIGLSRGEPDFDTPEHVEAAYKAMRAGQTRYTPVDGTPKLKQAIIEKFRSENAKVANLPIELPSKFKLVVNVQTAKALGLAVPRWCCCVRMK